MKIELEISEDEYSIIKKAKLNECIEEDDLSVIGDIVLSNLTL